MQYQLSPGEVKELVEMAPEVIERVLFTLKMKIQNYLKKKKQKRIDNVNNQ